MLTINGITVRLGGRAILDRATAAVPPGSKVGLIGRNGAGKSTLMKVIVGQLEADEGEIEMPRRTKLGYIAQEAPSGTSTPFETVLAADVERARDQVALHEFHLSGGLEHAQALLGLDTLHRDAVAGGVHHVDGIA